MRRILILGAAVLVASLSAVSAQDAARGHPLDPEVVSAAPEAASGMMEIVPLLDRDEVEPSFFPVDAADPTAWPSDAAAEPQPTMADHAGHSMEGME